MIYAVSPYERFRERVLTASGLDGNCPMYWSPEFLKWSKFDEEFIRAREQLINEICQPTFTERYVQQWGALFDDAYIETPKAVRLDLVGLEV